MTSWGTDVSPLDPRPRTELVVASASLFALAGVLALRVHDARWPLRVDQVLSGVIGVLPPRGLAFIPAAVHPSGLGYLVLHIGMPLLAVAAGVTLAATAWRRHDRWGALLSLAGPGLAVFLTEVVAKPLVDRQRGDALAFPSGHAAGAAAAAVVVLVLLDRWYGRRRALLWAPVVAIAPVVMGLGVVRLNWHYPTDAVGGIAFGAAIVLALAAALPRVRPAGEASVPPPAG